MSVLIKGGRIVTASDDYVGDVFADNGTVTLVGQALDVPADKVIDATGKVVMPGAIDPHTHLEMAFGGTVTCDDFTSGTTSAAFGGTTCLIDFCMQTPGESFPAALEKYQEKIERCKPVIDVGFHIGVTDLREGGTLDELAKLPDEGVTSYKLFMAYKGAVMVDDETLFKTMSVASETGALVMVHAENGDAIDVLVKKAVAEGHTEPIWHARTRPPITEGEATNRAIQLARVAGCPLYVVHVSCKEAIDPIDQARTKGWQAWGETCTQYLFIDETALDQPNFEGGKYIYTPPPRPKEHQEHLWHALATGRALGRLHRPLPVQLGRAEDARQGRLLEDPERRPGDREPPAHAPPLRRERGRISLNRFVELVSTNVAKFFGLYPRKGTIAPGSDADIVVWDPEKPHTISAATHHSNVDYNLFEGTQVVGAPRSSSVRGQVIVENDELVGRPGAGQFVKRARFGEELASQKEVVVSVRGMSDERHARSTRRRARAVAHLGERPGVLVIDFTCGFTDPDCILGSDLARRGRGHQAALDAARAKGHPVVYTTIGFEPHGATAACGCRRRRRSPTSSSAGPGSRSTRGSTPATTSPWC